MKKKLADAAFVYVIAGLAAGVFYREFTKFQGFSGRTALGLVHPHLLLLGAGVMLLLIALEPALLLIGEERSLKRSLLFYHCGLGLTAALLLIRGVFQVLGSPLSRGLDASISGIAGIGHILLAIGLCRLLLMIRRRAAETVRA
ncbi:DUF2871 domain-containing protein [Angelakisella massiliensis]|uniref:DUF2871 domain-containing protein n=1 Tax=Angelakisella massiliensis TaxID=1871018 RepID=UPI0023A86F9C|nr:DUF2871 domain-containing protein [Angelakisella massiliensis]